MNSASSVSSAPAIGVGSPSAGAAFAVTAAGARARACGFGGKLCIHPAQIDPVRAGFRPSAAQLDWARRVIGAGAAAVQIDGQMIDKPVIDRARHILRRAGTDA